MTTTIPASDSFQRSALRRTKPLQSATSVVISDAVDATEIDFETRTESCLPKSRTESIRNSVAQPIPSVPRVGPHNFEKIRILGAGSTGRVYLVRSVGLGNEEYYAMKVVKKSELVKRNRVQRILTERQILSVANHPFIVTLHYCFQTADFFYLVMQYCAGGELFTFLRSQENHRLSETQARFYAAEVLIALEYLHLIGIIYRDLKPENVLVHESGHVMLSDFDLAHEVRPASTPASIKNRSNSSQQAKQLLPPLSPTISTSDPELWFRMRDRRQTNRKVVAISEAETTSGSRRRRFSCPCVCTTSIAYPHLDTESQLNLGEKRTSFVGTHEYVAPEIIAEEGYVGSVDWWAFGILLFEMMYGTTPFKGETQIQTLENILDISGEIEFPPEIMVSDACRDLIEKLLAKTVSSRLQNPLLIKSHPFFSGVVWPLIRHQQPPIVPTMVHSLKEREFADKDLSEFDDEVPFHRALGSPRQRASQRYSISSSSSNGSTLRFPSIVQLSCNEESNPCESALGALNDGTGREAVSSVATTNSDDYFAKHPSPLSSSPSRSDKEMGESPARSPYLTQLALHASSTSPDSNLTDGVIHDFEFVSNQQRNYWSSTDSHRSLTAKLSQLEMMASAQEPEGCIGHFEEENEADNDEDVAPLESQDQLAGALGLR